MSFAPITDRLPKLPVPAPRVSAVALAAGLLVLAAACGDDGGEGSGNTSTYTFDSAFDPGQSSVNHEGQTTRQILLIALIDEMQRISDGVLDGSLDPTDVDEPGEVQARLDAFYVDGSGGIASVALPDLVASGDTTCQATYEDLGDANLVGKVAGEDDVTDFRDWDGDDGGDPAFAGTVSADVLVVPDDGTVATPVGLVRSFFATFEEQVRRCVASTDDCPTDADGNELPLTVTPDGLDLAQLVEKVLLGAIHFSQTADDYLDDDVEGKGLLADHTMPRNPGAPDSTLEHAWDEGFGYFGAAADYADYTDDEIRAGGDDRRPDYANGYHDTDGDGCIDVFTEVNFAASVNAAKRDAGSGTGTDLTGDAFTAFVDGRQLLADTAGTALDGGQLSELGAIRDRAGQAYARALAATAIHYVNELTADLAACGTPEASFLDLAKHWGELKGFAVGLQFDPRSPFAQGQADFDMLHALIGDRPPSCDDVGETPGDLATARDLLRDAYDFDQADAAVW